jgi:VanZ family protein
MRRRPVAPTALTWLPLVAALAFVVGMTIGPPPDGVIHRVADHLASSPYGRWRAADLLEKFFNVCLFVPVGAALWVAGVRPVLTTIAFSALGSLAIEVVQSWSLVGRQPQLSDVVMNTLGAAVGATTVWVLLQVLRVSPPRAAR